MPRRCRRGGGDFSVSTASRNRPDIPPSRWPGTPVLPQGGCRVAPSPRLLLSQVLRECLSQVLRQILGAWSGEAPDPPHRPSHLLREPEQSEQGKDHQHKERGVIGSFCGTASPHSAHASSGSRTPFRRRAITVLSLQRKLSFQLLSVIGKRAVDVDQLPDRPGRSRSTAATT